MNQYAQPETKIHLPCHDYERMTKVKPGSTLFCDAGILWVTQSGDRNDYILSPGETMLVTKRGKVLVEAMREADFHIA